LIIDARSEHVTAVGKLRQPSEHVVAVEKAGEQEIAHELVLGLTL
jgi:hypothetical protein